MQPVGRLEGYRFRGTLVLRAIAIFELGIDFHGNLQALIMVPLRGQIGRLLLLAILEKHVARAVLPQSQLRRQLARRAVIQDEEPAVDVLLLAIF